VSTSQSTTRRRRPARVSFCAVLVAIPVIAALSVPLYQRTDPTLGGIPFFFWFQIMCAVAAAAACGLTYLLLFHGDETQEV
jgi:hypothetical protein